MPVDFFKNERIPRNIFVQSNTYCLCILLDSYVLLCTKIFLGMRSFLKK